MIFISSFPHQATELPVNIAEFTNLLKDYLSNMGTADDEIAGIKKFSHSIVDRLFQIFQANDKYFFNNNHLVAELFGKIAVRMGLEETLVEAIQMAALLRDLGKLVIQRQLLDDSRKLSPGGPDIDGRNIRVWFFSLVILQTLAVHISFSRYVLRIPAVFFTAALLQPRPMLRLDEASFIKSAA